MSTEIEVLDEVSAKVLTARIKTAVAQMSTLPDLIAQAYIGQAWRALGFASWDAYCLAELDTDHVKIPRANRGEIVTELRGRGLSVRAIAAATGAAVGTVHADLAGVQDRTRAEEPNRDFPPPPAPPAPTNVVGIDGKPYPATAPLPAPAAPRRGSLPDAYTKAIWELEKAISRLEKLHADDRFHRHRSDLAGSSSNMLRLGAGRLAVLRAEMEIDVVDVSGGPL